MNNILLVQITYNNFNQKELFKFKLLKNQRSKLKELKLFTNIFKDYNNLSDFLLISNIFFNLQIVYTTFLF